MKNILFITQKIDRNDDVLGVYHRWAEEFGKKTDKFNVLCLYKGESNLDKNIGVFSLGKEGGISRIKYIYRFYKYIISLRKDYDTVLVHMNPVYIALGGVFWKLTGKKIFLWYNHPMGNVLARVGIFFSNKVFCTSPHSFSAKYKKTLLMPVGIDTNFFKKNDQVAKKNNRILYLGRISPIKHIDYLVRAGKILDSKKIDFEMLIVGSPASLLDKKYELELKKISSELINSGKIVFKSSMPNYETPDIYNSSQIFVNLTPSGSFDKTTLEAMACETMILVSNKVFTDFFTEEIARLCMFAEKDFIDLALKIENILLLPISNKLKISQQSRNIVERDHNLTKLINQIVASISN